MILDKNRNYGGRYDLSRTNLVTSCVLGSALIFAQTAVSQPVRRSAVYCDNHARNYSQHASRQGQVLGGGAIGSLVGLGLGAIGGAAGVGAAIGAGVGMIGGGVKRQQTADTMYSAAYRDCMAGRPI